MKSRCKDKSVSSPLIIIQASNATYLNMYSYYYNSCEAWNIDVVIVMSSRAPPGRTSFKKRENQLLGLRYKHEPKQSITS